jgi:hypothetical protein
MCAPGDQRKSSNNQSQQVEVNAVQRPRQADVSEGNDLAKGWVFAPIDLSGLSERCKEFGNKNGTSKEL